MKVMNMGRQLEGMVRPVYLHLSSRGWFSRLA